MALRNKDDWKRFFVESDIPGTECENYAEIMASNRITDPSDLTRDLLKELGVTVAGDIISIMKKATITDQADTKRATNLTSTSRPRPTSVKPPELKSEMTHPEFRKYRIDWGVFKNSPTCQTTTSRQKSAMHATAAYRTPSSTHQQTS